MESVILCETSTRKTGQPSSKKMPKLRKKRRPSKRFQLKLLTSKPRKPKSNSLKQMR